MGPLVVALLTLQTPVSDIETIVAKAAPKAKWSIAREGEAIFLTASSEEKFYEGGLQSPQGPPQTQTALPRAADLTITANDQLWLVPVGKPSKPNWKKLESSYAIMDVDCGVGHGYRWLSRGSFHFSESVRRVAKLTGGEDRLKTAIRGLDRKDMGQTTHNSAYFTLVYAKDRAIPYLRTEIARNDKATKYAVIGILGQIRTPKAGEELLRQYKTGDQHMKAAVGGVAAYRPYLPMLKPALLDVLRTGRHKLAPAEAARQFGWSDFLPDLKKAYLDADTPGEALAVYEAIDRFEGRKISEDVRAAAHVTDYQPHAPNRIKLLTNFPDPTYRTLAALKMIGYATKGGAPFREEGKELLATVPDSVKQPLIKRLNMDYLARS